jgi:hypothetical protein
LVAEPLQFVYDVEAAVHNERVHPFGFGAEAGDAIPALLGGTEFKFEERIVFRAHYAKIIRHENMVNL